MENSAASKLKLGLERLAKAGTDADMLGLALQSIHGALEDGFRAQIAANPQVPESLRTDVLDPKKVQWKDLLDAMMLYRDLSAADRDTIWRTNGVRTRVAHGGRYTGTRAELESYATLAQRLGGIPAVPAPAAASKHTRPAATAATQRGRTLASTAPEIPRATRSRPTVTQPRSRLSWLVILSVTALLAVLAATAIIRNSTQASNAADAQQLPTTTANASAAAPATALPRSATVRASAGLRLRADHSTTAQVLETLAEGTRVTIVGGPLNAENYTWWQVTINDHTGWCAGDFLQFEQP